MDSVYLTANSVGRLAPALLTLIIGIYLLTLRNKTSRTHFLAWYFLLASLYHFGHLYSYSYFDPMGRWGWYLAATGIFMVVFKTRFVYHLPRNSFPREERFVFWFSLILVGATWIEYLIRAGLDTVFMFQIHHYGPPFNSKSIPIAFFLGFIWSIVVLIRQSFQRDADNRAALIFLGLTLIELLLCIFVILERAQAIPATPDTTEMLMNFSLVILYFLYALFYLNLSSERSSFIAKLVGISMITLVTILSALGLHQINQADAAYDHERLEDARAALRRHTAGRQANPAERLNFPANSDRHPGLVSYIARRARDGRTTLVYSTADDVKFPERPAPAARALTTAERSYRQLGDQIYVLYNMRSGPEAPTDTDRVAYEVAFDYRAYRKQIHRVARSYAYAISLTILFMLLVFPLFFRATVTAPLHQLLGRLQAAGLRREENRDRSEDDLVFLSRSFTQMTKLLKDAKSQFYEFGDHIEEVENSVESYGRDRPIAREAGDREILYVSRAMRDVIAQADRFAAFDQPVLVTGETGTGKELIARLIHNAGPRKSAPFVDVNCAAIAGPLWESEIFGHARGAFTDASSDRPGRVTDAATGTLFFDEIGEMPLNMQAKMLRLLQERTYRPVGGDDSLPARCRFVFATNCSLASMVQAGDFREDLFYRINVFHVHIPPLRERPADVRALIGHFIAQISRNSGLPPAEAEPAACDALTSYHWPGNIRELQNVLVQAIAIAGSGRLSLKDLPRDLVRSARSSKQARANLRHLTADADAAQSSAAGQPTLDRKQNFDELMKAYARRLIQDALQHARGNKAYAADILGMKRGRLRYQINELDIDE